MSHPLATEPVTRSRAFWTVVAYAVLLGVVGGLIAVAFIGLVDWLVELIWAEPAEVGLFDGEPWWILLIGAFGLLIGITRKLLKVEPVIPGLFDEIRERRVEPTTAPRRVLVAFISLLSGASVGPEAPLGAMGGGLGTWLSERQGLSDEVRETNTLTGMAGTFGGFFTSPLVSSILVIEAAKPGGARSYVMAWIPVVIAATVGFSVFITISGGTLLGLYDLPTYEVDVSSFIIAAVLGLVGAAIAALLGLTMGIVHRLTMPLRSRPIVLAVAGGLLLGLIAWVFPLTLFSGTTQLSRALEEAASLGAFALLALAAAKILAIAITFGSGFWGGPIFPMIFVGGVSGAAVHTLVPEIPIGLAVVCLLAAVPGAGAALPFTLSILAAFTLTLGSPTDAAPAVLAAAVSYAVYNGFLDLRQRRPVAAERAPRDATGKEIETDLDAEDAGARTSAPASKER